MLPPQERLVARDLVGVQVDHRLVVEGELAELDGLAELEHATRPTHCVRIEPRVEERVTDVLLPFGTVHRSVSLFQQHDRVIADGDAHAGRHQEGPSVELDGGTDCLQQTLGDPNRFGRLGDHREHDGELVTSEPRGDVARAQALLDAATELGEDSVPDVVAPAVVHALEVVEVDEQQRSSMLRLLAERDHVLQLLVEERAVREVRQGVVERHLTQLLVRFALGGDVEQIALEVDRVPVVVEDDDALVADPHEPPVLCEEAVLDAQRLMRGVRVGMRREHAVTVVRVQRANEQVAVGRPFLLRVAEQRFDLPAREDVRARGVERVEVHDQWKLLDECPVSPRDVVVVRHVQERRGAGSAAVLHTE